MATTTTSGKFSLDAKDFLKGAILAVLTPVVTVLIQTLQAGSLVFNWTAIGVTAASAFLAYLVKNYLSPAQIVIENPSSASVKAVKEGTAKATVVNKTS